MIRKITVLNAHVRADHQVYRSVRVEYLNGDLYVGLFKNNKKNGCGEMRYHDGSTYDGRWLDDLRHGSGTFLNSAGLEEKGIWDRGKLVSSDNFKNNEQGENPKIEKSEMKTNKAVGYICLVIGGWLLVSVIFYDVPAWIELYQLYNSPLVNNPISQYILELSNQLTGNALSTRLVFEGLFSVIKALGGGWLVSFGLRKIKSD